MKSNWRQHPSGMARRNQKKLKRGTEKNTSPELFHCTHCFWILSLPILVRISSYFFNLSPRSLIFRLYFHISRPSANHFSISVSFFSTGSIQLLPACCIIHVNILYLFSSSPAAPSFYRGSQGKSGCAILSRLAVIHLSDVYSGWWSSVDVMRRPDEKKGHRVRGQLIFISNRQKQQCLLKHRRFKAEHWRNTAVWVFNKAHVFD